MFYLRILLAILLAFPILSFVTVSRQAEQPVVVTTTTAVSTAHKSFFYRLFHFDFFKRHKEEDTKGADGLATTSLFLGTMACLLIPLGFISPFLFLASIPFGIAAMITGGAAVRKKTSKIGQAKTGKALGLGALITFGLLLVLAAIIVAGTDWN